MCMCVWFQSVHCSLATADKLSFSEAVSTSLPPSTGTGVGYIMCVCGLQECEAFQELLDPDVPIQGKVVGHT